MVIKKFYISIIFFITLISINLKASQILDYESEIFIRSLINEIKKVNNIEQKLKFVIISDDNINAFVDYNDIIYITSGLIQNCEDYVALISVLAHEIGHIDKKHVDERKSKIQDIKNLNSLSTLSIIAGSLVSQNPQYLPSLGVSNAKNTEYLINFNKDQEREADYYSLETLKKLNIYSSSIINLLKNIENKNKERGIDTDDYKLGTHPYFEERIDIINYLNEKKENTFDKNINLKFKFIKSKFTGYNSNLDTIKKLEYPFSEYAYSIYYSRNGNLKKSLSKINKLIQDDKKNYFLIETKADILFSFGYIKESIEFYKLVYNKFPNNYYAQIRIFQNINYEDLSQIEIENLFKSNLNLLYKFYNNKNILFTYLRLSKIIKKDEWQIFLNFWLNKKDDLQIIKKELNKFKQTNNNDLFRLVDLIYDELK